MQSRSLLVPLIASVLVVTGFGQPDQNRSEALTIAGVEFQIGEPYTVASKRLGPDFEAVQVSDDESGTLWSVEQRSAGHVQVGTIKEKDGVITELTRREGLADGPVQASTTYVTWLEEVERLSGAKCEHAPYLVDAGPDGESILIGFRADCGKYTFAYLLPNRSADSNGMPQESKTSMFMIALPNLF